MSDLQGLTELFKEELLRRNCSPHTIRSYGTTLRSFRDRFTRDGTEPALSDFNVFTMREWLAGLHEAGLEASTIRHHVAVLREFFEFLKERGLIRINPAKLVRIPKLPKKLPPVMTEDQVSRILNGVLLANRWNAKRDLAILEVLYGCGIR